ncbi:MAG: flagellar assembly peptidoglycan hydrolase FlgJ [Hydrogenophaga sp.]|uniref:flagellar assembly peptidoglycan hydrolase FlgJ n=1 Tax=Hydrogenophaga sp. TaxID=1904254 RepID=UPI0016A74BD4|nr:flagellar assembly peptidoglycan hydrolase FlgJ [Hydrogenophaga sp.]NIM41660.1 flagellar assembly peptidoglycan hydrolase FlgJ [Hydrogenophaga sp.]NIN26965.1 flagellar assembly peptidoglycan hydrolase FlgJ [Hydrogenophaga sp.]NIN31666.1 flagellar assembly peptidoglycan hydrolase FlgJ [Hydrogenophaga sp.]NIN55910.1 flagellar assembly peptidoglycan hydrolase FlgJ [Hydrogenophaga sp.]NIO52037.1 flagellar assembly peptidoglycan hydrolase FlgJ [Hydrogenophaga sp.]
MIGNTAFTSPSGLAADPNALAALKGAGDSKAALKEAAKQFEALFMRELIKSMREATSKSGLFESQGENLGTDLLDQQFAQQLTGLPGGLSEAIERQLAGRMAGTEPLPDSATPSTVGRASAGERQTAFVSKHGAAAQAVARESGIPAAFMLGQAGHESGWGRGEIRHADGSPAHNLFGIKATGGWTGKVAEITTTEYINGEPRKVTAKFRAYDSYEDSFRDYARLIGNSPRYEGVMDQLHSVKGFAQGLQRAGYATDPSYAEKLGRAINTTLSLQRAQG